jgi:hypothetical protein
MRGFKAKVEEEQRIKQIKSICQCIYIGALGQAQKTTDTVYKYEVPKTRQFINMSHSMALCQFHTKNMPEILQELREMFPECLVKHARLVRGQDGKMYDMDIIDEKVLPFIDQSHSQEYITIDWS